jgi:hypothetical protein
MPAGLPFRHPADLEYMAACKRVYKNHKTDGSTTPPSPSNKDTPGGAFFRPFGQHDLKAMI